LNTSASREAPFLAAVVFFLAHVRAALRVSVIVRATDKCSTPAAKTPVALPRLSICGAAPDLPPAGASAGAALPYSFPERPGTLDFLAPSINYSSCRDVVQLYSVRHSGDMARIRDTAPVICRGFLVGCVMSRGIKGERWQADVCPINGRSRGPNFPCDVWHNGREAGDDFHYRIFPH
jgi:hypothetical protein